MQKTTALVLLSGGLDSMLAAKILMEQGVEVVGLSFISYFFNAERAFEAAKNLGIPLIAYSFAPEHLAMVKQPKYGYGKNLNPCIDCHSLMVRKAKEIMEGEEVVLIYPDQSIKAVARQYDLVATGEVLGQRPMSQTKASLSTVAKFSGLGDRLVRPLSAKLLDLTLPEKEGKINREELLDISGRSRTRQQALAKKFGLTDYPSPAGGCLLTDPVFGERLRTMFENWPACTGDDIKLLRMGRLFWSNLNDQKVLIVIGRDQKDNEALEKGKRSNDVLIKLAEELGPIGLVRVKNFEARMDEERLELVVPEAIDETLLNLAEVKTEQEAFQQVAHLVGYYAKKLAGKKVTVRIN